MINNIVAYHAKHVGKVVSMRLKKAIKKVSKSKLVENNKTGSDYDTIIYGSASTAGSCAAVGAIIPGVDLGAIPGCWTAMTIAIAAKAGLKLSYDAASKFITSILGGVGAFLIREKAMTKLLNFIPGVGALGEVAIDAVLVFIITVRLGVLLKKEFERPGFSLQNMDSLAAKAIGAILLIPGADELKEAFNSIKDIFKGEA